MNELLGQHFSPAGGHFSQDRQHSISIHRLRQFRSEYLPTRFSVDIYLPPDYDADSSGSCPVLFFNDGQDMERVRLADTLHRLYSQQKIPSLIVVAIHAGERLQEYGIARQADYKNRGSKAGFYTQFIVNELLPFVQKNYSCKISPEDVAFAGFSLGGLSAMDIVWNHPKLFGKAGVFSGSFWWRSRSYTDDDPDGGRILHDILSLEKPRPGMKFWLQAGTKDEDCDRNKNGIIDAIDDTLDLILVLKKLGYRQPQDIHYREVEGGTHHPVTWAEVLPEFLVWAFG